MTDSAMTMGELNTLDREAFVAAVGWVFEHSPWVAERAWPRRPFATLGALHTVMTEAVANATPDEQLALIRAHPDLGARARMTAASAGEQSGAGLDRLTPEQFERLHRLNPAYRGRFGFPFIYAVKGAAPDAILEALEKRLANEPGAERAAALAQIYRIAYFRLEHAISCTTS
jgi:2-oxo-4-hydroxy-4-carboxy-5-ureidoimidazoline decarboxylase